MKKLFNYLTTAALLVPAVASAHPVAWKGAWSVMAFNQPDMQDWQVLYSFERQFSVGVDFFHDTMEGPDRYFLIPRLSWLIKRWNETDSQANIYVYGGVGSAHKDGTTKAAAEGSVEADYETRSFYTSAKALVVGAKGFDSLTVFQGRVGFAPYVAESGQLHTWFILQSQYFPNANEERLRIGPMLRFFYQNVLWETGVSAKGTWNLNFMVHF